MNTLILAVAAILLGQTPPTTLGKVHKQPISVTVAQLDALEQVPSESLQPLFPRLFTAMHDTRSQAVKIRVMQLLCRKISANEVATLVTKLREAREAQGSGRVSAMNLLEAALSQPVSTWSPHLRSSPGMKTFLLETTARPGGADARGRLAVRALVDMAETDAAKRATLLEIITAQGMGAWDASSLLIPLLNEPSRIALRNEVRDRQNPAAMRILGEVGDVGALQIAQQQLQVADSAGSQGKTTAAQIREMIWKIEQQSPPAKLLVALSTPEHSFYHVWLLRRAVAVGLPGTQIKSALNLLSTNAAAGDLRILKAVGIECGVLTSADLPGAPQYQIAQCGADSPTTTPPPSVRRPRARPWTPNEANYEVLGNWMQSVDWDSLSEEQGFAMLQAKLCELKLISPEECGDD